jgi:hypothetical protein
VFLSDKIKRQILRNVHFPHLLFAMAKNLPIKKAINNMQVVSCLTQPKKRHMAHRESGGPRRTSLITISMAITPPPS